MKDLKQRTKEYALAIIKLFSILPKKHEIQIIGKQLLRSGTSVGAHYREGVRARSSAEFISKLSGGLQELEESAYWLELLLEVWKTDNEQITVLYEETNQLIAILVTCVNNARKKWETSRDNIK